MYAGCGVLAFYLQAHSFTLTLRYQLALMCGVLLFYPIMSSFNIYHSLRGKNFIEYFRSLCLAFVVVMLLLAATAFIMKTGEYYSREWFLLWHLYAIVTLLLVRIILLNVLYVIRKRGLNRKKIIIIGSGKLAAALVATIKKSLWSGFEIAAVFEHHLDTTIADVSGIQIQSMPMDVGNYIRQNNIAEVWLVLSLWDRKDANDLLHKLNYNVVTLRYFPDVVGLNVLDHSMTEILGFPVINIIASPMTGTNRLVKALEDRMLSFLILLLISPIMLIIALLVKLSSPGPILYRQLRHGWDGKPIYVYKFRTMHVHNEPHGVVTQATSHDPRITKIGKLLRHTSLDELPQFINVLQGRMSIVGPRPHAIEHNEYYKNLITSYMLRHHVKPGITGWAQINGWRGETDTLEKMQKRIEHDLYYINHWSLWFDIKIIFLTLLKGFVDKNAY